MISDSIEYKDAESAKEFFSSPVDASPNRGGDASCGLSTTTSESSSQPNSWTSRDDSPNSKTPGSFSSYMPIVDEDDCRAPDSRDGHTSSEEEQPATPSTAIAAFHKAAYDSQVRRWQQEELQYMRHEGWCEHRVVLLLQEAFRCSYVNLKQAHAEGLLAADVFAARTAELKTSLATIKKEYRRTLTRTHERRGDVASIASKAVACVASVYPWSSSGFVLGFEENLRYADLAGLASGSARRGAAAAAVAGCAARPAETAPPSAPTVAAVPMPQLEADVDEDDDTGIAESVIAGGRSRRIATPRVTLQPLPPRRQLFQRGTAPLSPAPTAASPSAVVVATAPVDVAARTVAASPPPTGTRSPMTLPPASTAGPLRPGEARFLEKRQLVVHGMAFVSRSLASTTFIASRRATIAAATMRHRLGLVKEAETEEAPAEDEDEEESQMSSTPASFVSRRLMKPPQQEQQQKPQPQPQQPRTSVVGAAATVPSLPTRYITDLSSTPCEAAAFDSNPSSLTRRSNPSSVTKRTVLANPASYAAPPPPPPLPVANAANTPRSVTGTVTKRALKPVSGSSGGCACTTLPPSVPNNSGMRSQPHSYTGRVSHVPAVVPSQPHSYTTRSVQLPMTALAAAGAMPTPVYVAPPCQTFRVDPQDCVMVAAGVPPAYCAMAAAAGPPPPPTDYGATYAPPSAPPPPPAYTSHVRRDRLRPPAAPFNGAYGAVPPVSVEDEQYVKELW